MCYIAYILLVSQQWSVFSLSVCRLSNSGNLALLSQEVVLTELPSKKVLLSSRPPSLHLFLYKTSASVFQYSNIVGLGIFPVRSPFDICL